MGLRRHRHCATGARVAFFSSSRILVAEKSRTSLLVGVLSFDVWTTSFVGNESNDCGSDSCLAFVDIDVGSTTVVFLKDCTLLELAVVMAIEAPDPDGEVNRGLFKRGYFIWDEIFVRWIFSKEGLHWLVNNMLGNAAKQNKLCITSFITNYENKFVPVFVDGKIHTISC
ncbi:hypothetical protein GUJ93_ZPchr0002g26348 [Zizania palustris]|uniref:Uncharacterized protein n=1 Tax=Zizania palustris TaxID=103762 RepID=A0A8J5SSC6_ZIZPA|nr:hypothetical protein GUJ93_ZPchr0002g26348 [Zizania palustris]